MKFRYHENHLKNELRLALAFGSIGIVSFIMSILFVQSNKIEFLGPSFIIASVMSFIWVLYKKKKGYVHLDDHYIKTSWWMFNSKIELNKLTRINYFYDEIQIYQENKCLNINMKEMNLEDLKKLKDLLHAKDLNNEDSTFKN